MRLRHLYEKLRLLVSSYILAFIIVGCGGTGDNTPVNVLSLQNLANNNFPLGLMLYVENIENKSIRAAINLINAPSELPFPNGKYHMALVGIVDDGAGNYISKCGLAKVGGLEEFELAGGLVDISVTMSQNGCAAGPFSHEGWVNTSANPDVLKNLNISFCNGSATACSPATSAVGSVRVNLLPYKTGPFANLPDTQPLGVCVSVSGGYANKYLRWPGADHTDIGTNLFRTGIEAFPFGNSNCSLTPVRSFVWNGGLDYTIHEQIGEQVSLFVSTDVSLKLSMAPVQVGFAGPSIYDFGSIPVYQGESLHKFKLINPKSTSVTITDAPTISGGSQIQYAGGCSPGQIPAGGFCMIDVKYKPTSTGSASGYTLSIGVDGINPSVSLTGMGVGEMILTAAEAAIPTGSAFDFNSENVGSGVTLKLANWTGVPIDDYEVSLLDDVSNPGLNLIRWTGVAGFPGAIITGPPCNVNFLDMGNICTCELQVPAAASVDQYRTMQVKFNKGLDIVTVKVLLLGTVPL
ncbi:MAG: hypothetical protein JNM93_13785 [Bacteriovoracaceae bacterium]|nr:hypothetical protein [Bacteriovoracaceae bacterium]